VPLLKRNEMEIDSVGNKDLPFMEGAAVGSVALLSQKNKQTNI
jgi:hypothetical protein